MGPFRFALWALLATSAAFAAKPLSADDVIQLAGTKGPREAVSVIWRSRDNAQRFLAGVSAAEAQWLEAAKAVAPGADAGAAEELSDALAVALLTKPYELLPWLREYWWGGSASICVFSADDELPGGVVQYIGRLEVALSEPAPRGLSAIRNQCLLGLKETRKALLLPDRRSQPSR